jgi:uncharacterized protein
MTGSVGAQTLQELDRLGDRVQAETGGELAVVVVDRVEGGDTRGFALELFNSWGIGSHERHDGVLLFLSLGDRAAEIILGDGLDDPVRQQASDEIMAGEMVPSFRAGRVDEGLLKGAASIAHRILGLDRSSPPPSDGAASARPTAAREAVAAPPHARPLDARSHRPRPATDLRALAAPIGFLGLLAAGGLGLLVLGLRPPRCSSCKVSRVKLDEATEDAYLEPEDLVEEEIGSVDHQVWLCPSCGDALEIARHRWLSGYSSCTECGRRTWHSSERLIAGATTWSEGRVRVDGQCASCGHQATSYRTIPRVEESTSDSSFFGSTGSSSGSDSSGSSSGSSGFGGGRSSGGGSSGRW